MSASCNPFDAPVWRQMRAALAPRSYDVMGTYAYRNEGGSPPEWTVIGRSDKPGRWYAAPAATDEERRVLDGYVAGPAAMRDLLCAECAR